MLAWHAHAPSACASAALARLAVVNDVGLIGVSPCLGCVLFVNVYVMRTNSRHDDECSTHGVALTRTLCTHRLIMFTGRQIALPVSFRVA